MAAAAVELDALPDSVRTAAENHDLLPPRHVADGFVIFRVGRIIVRRRRGEFARACIDGAVGGMDAVFLPQRANPQFVHAQHIGQLPVRIAKLLRFPQALRRVFDRRFKCGKFRQFAEIEHVKTGQLLNLLQRPAAFEGGMEHIDAVGVRTGQFGRDFFIVHLVEFDLFLLQPEAPMARLQRADGLLEGLVEVPSDRHRLADGLHLRAKRRIRRGKLFKREPRHLHDNVIENRLEAGGRVLRDVVAQFIQ